jgi:hypothetical protein
MILVHLSDPDTGQGRVWLALAEHDGGGLRLVTRDRADLLFAVEERATSPGQ